MILSKLLINQVANYLTKHFKLDKVMNYVFDDNELDKKVRKINKRVEMLEMVAHPPRNFIVCEKCNKETKEENNG